MSLKRKELFDFMIKQVRNVAAEYGDKDPQAFGRWFANMYFPGITSVVIPDGSGDGKVDLMVTANKGRNVKHFLLNTKFTVEYDKPSPVAFYDEITRYWQAFENKANRASYLKGVRPTLHDHFKKVFRYYDDGDAELYFVTNHRVNEKQLPSVKRYGVRVLHLDDVLQYVTENIEGAMPQTDPLLLSGISNVLTPATNESEVPTSIVFARLKDFIDYMREDPFDLLFARNVRLWLGPTETNKAITQTFENHPKEFAYSNNGITILCKSHTHDPGKQELRIENPRVVNGSQTLHSIREADAPSPLARAMVRIIEIPSGGDSDVSARAERRKEIIHKISIRSNQQNPIKRWNLVSNDDFQNELSRYFWSKKLYYERRQKEWSQRKLQLQAIGIRKGPDLRWMMQLVASYFWDHAGLGPAVAQGQLNSLFEEDTYPKIRELPAPVVFQLFLLGDLIEKSLRRLSARKRYIDAVRGYVGLSVFTIVSKIASTSGARFGTEKTERQLLAALKHTPKNFDSAIKGLVDHVLRDFERVARKVKRQEERDLSHPTYFKNATVIRSLIRSPVPPRLKRGIADIFRD